MDKEKKPYNILKEVLLRPFRKHVTCVSDEIFFITEAQINVTITMPVLLARCVKNPRFEGL